MLAVDEKFKLLFIVIIFHCTSLCSPPKYPPLSRRKRSPVHDPVTEMFEGLGIGSRLTYLVLPPEYRYITYVGAFLYGVTTLIGIVVGLSIRTAYNPGSTQVTLFSGILESLCVGNLLYTGFVELLAHEFLFSPEMHEASLRMLLYALVYMMLGCGLMALLGKWA